MFIGDITTTETPMCLLWQLRDKQMSQDEIMRQIKVQSSVCVIVFNARKSANAHWGRIKSGASVRKSRCQELNMCLGLLLNIATVFYVHLIRSENNDDHVSTSPKLPLGASAVAKSAAPRPQAAAPFSWGYSGANPRGVIILCRTTYHTESILHLMNEQGIIKAVDSVREWVVVPTGFSAG